MATCLLHSSKLVNQGRNSVYGQEERKGKLGAITVEALQVRIQIKTLKKGRKFHFCISFGNH